MTLVQAQENPNVLLTVSLLTAYCFDLRGLAPTQLINEWLETFSALWIRLAVIEALYLGRYKAISVEHLLQYWAVKGQPNFHFSAEFEQMVSQKLPKSLLSIAGVVDANQGSVSSVEQGKIRKMPGVIKHTQPSAQTYHGVSPNPIVPTPSPALNSPVDQGHKPMPVPAKSTRKTAPSIEQFIPIAVESDLLSKLQSVLNQGSMAVNS
jgi:hypothetical protein